MDKDESNVKACENKKTNRNDMEDRMVSVVNSRALYLLCNCSVYSAFDLSGAI